MLGEELSRLTTVAERHHRLFARLLLAFLASLLVFFVGTVLIWAFESGQTGTDIHGFGDAAFSLRFSYSPSRLRRRIR